MNKILSRLFTQKDISTYVATNVGNVRLNNQDNYCIDNDIFRQEENQVDSFNLNPKNKHMFVVCDGMGGEAYGELASEISVKTFNENFLKITLSRNFQELSTRINEVSTLANNRICKMVAEKKCGISGSTLAMILVDGLKVYPFSIGDSRVYAYVKNELYQVTEDQTLAQKKFKDNIYTKEEAEKSLDAHKLTNFLGMDNRKLGVTALNYPTINVSHNDIILICSDGLTDMCNMNEIQEVLCSDSKNLAEELVNKALQNGGQDNITCIVIKF